MGTMCLSLKTSGYHFFQDFTAGDEWGETSLNVALKFYQKDMANLLLERGAEFYCSLDLNWIGDELKATTGADDWRSRLALL